MTWIAQTSALFSTASKSFNNTAATASGNQEENGIWALFIIANKTTKKSNSILFSQPLLSLHKNTSYSLTEEIVLHYLWMA